MTEHIKTPTPELEAKLKEFLALCSYVAGQYDSDPSFVHLEEVLVKIESGYPDKKETNRIFYMALPPSVFVSVAQHLKRNNYVKNGATRIIVEKPFGSDLQSSRDMQTALKKEFTEDEVRAPSCPPALTTPQIFRIDHYLGKEMVKNLLVLRFANVMLDASFNKHLISNVQITFKEPFGTEGRGGYFDEFGIIRDVMQNRACSSSVVRADTGTDLLQVLSILTMERPISFSAEDIRDEKVKVLRYIPAIVEDETLLGQYVAATNDKGEQKPGYLEDDTVPKGSICPTFAAVVLHINSPRWEGVPFILKAGKGPSSSSACWTGLTPDSAQRAEDRDSHSVQGRDAGHLQGDHAQRAGHPRSTRRGGVPQDELQGAWTRDAHRPDRDGSHLQATIQRSQNPRGLRVRSPHPL